MVPLSWGGHTLRYKEANWINIRKGEFRSYIVRLALRQRRSYPGPIRWYWRERRYRAVRYFESRWGQVPDVMKGRNIPPQNVIYKSKDWERWAM